MHPELEQAIPLLRNNDGESVQEALRLLQKTVFSFSMRICGHREDAEDTMQEVLASSLRHLAKIDNASALSVWLYKAAKNRCWRSRRKEAWQRSISFDELTDGSMEPEALFAAFETSPEQQVLRKDGLHLIREAILRLPARYRIVLALHDLEELDAKQIAQALSLEPGAVRVRLHRARLLLRDEMDALFEPALGRTAHRWKQREADPQECMEIFGNLGEYLEGQREAETCERVKARIAACPQCVDFIRDLKLAIDRCRLLTEPVNEAICASLRRLVTQEYLRLVHRPRRIWGAASGIAATSAS